MFLDVFRKTWTLSTLLLYDKEGKPVGRKINSSKPFTFLKKLPRNPPKMCSAGCIL